MENIMIAEMERAARNRPVYLQREKQDRKRKVHWYFVIMLLTIGLIGTIGLRISYLRRYYLFTACPPEITEFVEKYPESIELAVNYRKCAGLKPQRELLPQDLTSGIPLLIQWDKRWAYQQYGGGFLGTKGCGPTSLCMVYAGLTGEVSFSPAKMAEWAEKQGYYVPGVGSAWTLMTDGAAEFGLSATPCGISQDIIRSELQQGKPLICSMHAGDFTRSGHFIVLTDIDDHGMVSVNDSNSRSRSAKKWELSYLVEQMDGAWSYEVEIK